MKKNPPYIETWDNVPEPPQCNNCKHFQGYGICPAFPEGIPLEIITNDVIHSEEFGGQVSSIVWMAKGKI